MTRLRATRRALLRGALGGLLVLSGLACTQRVVRSPGVAEVAPMLSVERFLQASNAADYDSMARLFGTTDGPIADTGGTFGCAFKKMGSWIGVAESCRKRRDVELHMAVLAEILRHQDYRIVSDRREPGQAVATNRVGVDITRQGTVIRDVPFYVVQTNAGDWVVQRIEVLRITGLQ